MRGSSSRNPSWWRAASYALGLHAVVIALLVVGFHFTSHTPPAHGPLQATVVREPSPDQQVQQERERTKHEEERKQRETEMKRVAEEQRVAAERKQKEEEKKKHDEAERKKKEEAQQQKKEKEEAERKKLADAEKRKREEEHKKELEQEQRKRQAQEEMQKQLADEEKTRSAARNARLASDLDKYKAAIAQRVSRHWVRPPSTRKGLQCTVHVRQAPGGEVLEARVVRSSGDITFDRSVESAVFKASPLPAPGNSEVFDRDIEFNFRPPD